MPPAPRPRRRVDAERSIAAIVAAARRTLGANPDATTEEIAKVAGVGRMTLYGHFRTRAELVEAAMVDALREGETTLSAVDLAGDADRALTRLLAATWPLVAEAAKLRAAADGVLPAGRMRELHAAPAARVADLIHRGQDEGAFRTDLPLDWLVDTVYYVLNGAAEGLRTGRLAAADADRVVLATVRSVLTT
ncbi:TetR/AcrR family transcriptional regulator [Nocardia asteroides]|uniref:TetR/AcrR family transcriptional regulator n=1 Tax=Nocardia asteroides TaxID=1824 RepID=UPI001E552481|nr:TetR/AcrR family transcriptional regulator [Nocardia asteroides]UGT58296.1 TetR/AcrR family transcriptional regulator [Nocardia asteroides]